MGLRRQELEGPSRRWGWGCRGAPFPGPRPCSLKAGQRGPLGRESMSTQRTFEARVLLGRRLNFRLRRKRQLDLISRTRSHRVSHSDHWIQSPECSPLHHGTAHSSLGPAAEPGPTQPRGPGPGPGPASRPARSSAAPSPLPPRPRREGPASPALGRPSELNLEDEKKSIGVGDRAGLSGLPQVCLLCGISRMFCPEVGFPPEEKFLSPL